MADLILDDVYFRLRNETSETVRLYGSLGTPFDFPPGAIYRPPKQIEALNAVRTHKATMLDGGAGGGKSVIAMCALNDLIFDWSVPGHTHGLDPAPCMVAHERTVVFLLGQTLTDIRRRNIPTWLDLFGEFGTLNKNDWEFTYHDFYGDHRVIFIGTDDPKKLRGMMAAAAFHDECTLDADFEKTFHMTLQRLRQAGIPHTPWIGATNTVGPSRGAVKEIFIDNPRPAKRDTATGRIFPGYTHIHSTIYDNPFMDRAVIFEMEQGSEFEVQAFLHGSWEQPEGAMFALEPGIHIVEDFPVDETWPGWFSMDFGFDHPTVGSALRMNPYTGQFHHNLVWSRADVVAKDAKVAIYDYFKDSRHPLELHAVRVGDVSGKRGGRKMLAMGLIDSSDWKIINTPTPLADGRLIPSFNLRPAYKDRHMGWTALREALAYKWEWRAKDAREPMSERNRVRFVTEPPKLTIAKSCWQTIASLSLLQHDPKDDGDAKKTTGRYGVARGDDEAENLRYVVMAAMRRMFGKLEANPVDTIAQPTHTQNPFLMRNNRQPAVQGASVWAK